MNVEHAASCVAYLTSMCTGWNDDTTEVLVYEFERLDNPDALREAVGKIARTWTQSWRVPLGVIMDAYQHEVAISEGQHRDILDAQLARCDGSGWDDDGAPCTTCNPALAQVWATPGGRLRWRHGTATWKILDFDSAADCDKELGRTKCAQVFDVEADSFDSRTGMRVALAAYRTEYRREPSPTQIAWLAAAGRPTRQRQDEF